MFTFTFSNRTFAILASSLLMVTACSNDTQNQTASQATNTTEETTQTDDNKPTYVVATGKQFKPFILRDDNNKLTGFDIDLVNAIADIEGFNVNFVFIPADKRFSELQAGNFDMIAAGVTITDERKQLMQFSQPYFTSYQAVAALPDKPAIKNFNELKQYKVGVIEHSTSDAILQNIMKDNSNHIEYVRTPYNGLTSVVQKNIDYVMSDSPVLTYFVNSPEFKTYNIKIYKDESLEPEYFGFVFAKDREDDLVDKVNQGLDTIKENGTYAKIEEKWFGNTNLNN